MPETIRQLREPPRISRDIFNANDRMLLGELRDELETSIVRSLDVRIDQENQWTYIQAMRWLAGLEFQAKCPHTGAIIPGNLSRGLYIAGNPGTGKSTLLRALLNISTRENIRWYYGPYEGVVRYGMAMHRKIMTDDLPLKADILRTDEITHRYSQDGDIDPYKRRRTLALDDLGSEPPESMYMGNRLGVMRQILEHRGDHDNLMTLIASNLPIYPADSTDTNSVLARYGERVASRLCAMCNYLPLVGKDRRQTTTNR